MQLLTQNLPSGKIYDFPSINIRPMTFAQILEYLENVPKTEVEKFYFDYCTVKGDDPNIDQLLISDLPYVIFMKKGITISKDIEISTTVKCPKCGHTNKIKFKLSDIEFNKLDQQLLNGLSVMFNHEYCNVSLPTVENFMKIFSKYRMYKKVTDLRIIKLISLFEDTDPYLQKYETAVLNATYKDVTVLAMLEDVFFDVVKPIHATCSNCVKSYKVTDEELELDPEELNRRRIEYGGIAVGVESLAADFFPDVLENNRLTNEEILLREVREDK